MHSLIKARFPTILPSQAHQIKPYCRNSGPFPCKMRRRGEKCVRWGERGMKFAIRSPPSAWPDRKQKKAGGPRQLPLIPERDLAVNETFQVEGVGGRVYSGEAVSYAKAERQKFNNSTVFGRRAKGEGGTFKLIRAGLGRFTMTL